VIHIAVADILRERNELEAAEQHLAWAMALGKLSGYLPITREGGQVLARLRLAQGDTAGGAGRAARSQPIGPNNSRSGAGRLNSCRPGSPGNPAGECRHRCPVGGRPKGPDR
jgi:hypothetical protein